MSHIGFATICEIGRSAQARISLVSDEQKREWAMKQLLRECSDPRSIARFRSEARVLARLAHPGIVPVVAAILDADRPFYLMPVASGSLADEVGPTGLDPRRVEEVAAELIGAIRYAHEQRILHRDLRPRKILQFGLRLCIADFGIYDDDGEVRTWPDERRFAPLPPPPSHMREPKPLTKNATHTPAVSELLKRSPVEVKIAEGLQAGPSEMRVEGRDDWFRPPEDAQSEDYDERSDIYSLGKILLHCLTGGMPEELPASMASPWRHLISRCIEREKDDRWSSAAVLQAQFELVFGHGAPLALDGALRWFAQLAERQLPLEAEDIVELRERIAGAGQDDVLVRRILVSLTREIVAAWAKHDPASLRAFVLRCDATISIAEDLVMCDIIADQYLMIFTQTRDPALRDSIRARLFRLGPSHNRRHVGQVFASLLACVRGPDEVAHVISLARTDRAAAAWNAPYCGRYDIDKRIRDALVGVRTAGWA